MSSSWSARTSLVTALGVLLLAAPALAGFAGSDVFLPMAGRQAGVHPSNWYTTVWVHNPGAGAVTARIYFLQRNTANPSPPWVDVMVAAGGTEKLENVVEEYFHLEAFGALRVACPERLIVTSRVYSKGVGAGEADSVGQDFAGVPASFAIGSGERAQILGTYQTTPWSESEHRFNFGFVETTGHAATVRVTVYDGTGALLGTREAQVREWSQRQAAFKDWFPDVSTANARLDVEVVSGSGRVIAYGSGIANGSQDPTTFDMSYADSLLGISGVQHDATLAGDGTAASPLGIAPAAAAGQVLATVAESAPAPGDSLSAASIAVAWRSPSSLSLGLTPGGVAFGSASGGLAQDAADLYWDAARGHLGIGTAAPAERLEVAGNLRLPQSTSSSGQVKLGNTRFLHGPGTDNTFLGGGAGGFNALAERNTGTGWSALAHNTIGDDNTAVGAGSLLYNANLAGNTAVGARALYMQASTACTVQSGQPCPTFNTAVGLEALRNNAPLNQIMPTGDRNTAVGAYAGLANVTGKQNTFLGTHASAAAADLVNATAVGFEAEVDASNHVRIGNAAVTQIGGQKGWSNLSDARAKEAIRGLDLGIDFVMALRPVQFTLKGGDGRTDLGFLAQDIEALLGDSYGLLGVGADPDRTLSLRYMDLIAPLVRAVQEQQRELAALRATVTELERRLDGRLR